MAFILALNVACIVAIFLLVGPLTAVVMAVLQIAYVAIRVLYEI